MHREDALNRAPGRCGAEETESLVRPIKRAVAGAADRFEGRGGAGPGWATRQGELCFGRLEADRVGGAEGAPCHCPDCRGQSARGAYRTAADGYGFPGGVVQVLRPRAASGASRDVCLLAEGERIVTVRPWGDHLPTADCTPSAGFSPHDRAGSRRGLTEATAPLNVEGPRSKLRGPSTYCPVRAMAEDTRFELVRGCPQHAFQACALGH